jgi:hypothetical protein
MSRPTPADLTQRLRAAMAASLEALRAAGDQAPPLRVPRASSPIGPGQLARSHPGSARERLELAALYQRCLQQYRQVHEAGVRPGRAGRRDGEGPDREQGVREGLDACVERDEVPPGPGDADDPADRADHADHDDLGTALAHFVAANLQALTGAPPPADALPALAAQLSAIVHGSPAWQAAPLRERQAYVEQVAILSVLMADLSRRAPREGAAGMANVQRGARGYLQQLLGLDPDQLMLGTGGLTLRQPALAA